MTSQVIAFRSSAPYAGFDRIGRFTTSKEFSMFDPAFIARAYLDTWNETDAERRRALLKKHWAEDAHYADPMMQGDGEAAIAALVGAVHERFPGFRFKPTGTPNGHGDYVRLSWSLGPDDAAPPIEGSDLLVLQDGRIRQVIGFIDRAPATA
jgi:hypothetical protein